MAAQYFEENGRVDKAYSSSDVFVECDQLAAVGVNVCEAAEAPKEQAGK